MKWLFSALYVVADDADNGGDDDDDYNDNGWHNICAQDTHFISCEVLMMGVPMCL